MNVRFVNVYEFVHILSNGSFLNAHHFAGSSSESPAFPKLLLLLQVDEHEAMHTRRMFPLGYSENTTLLSYGFLQMYIGGVDPSTDLLGTLNELEDFAAD